MRKEKAIPYEKVASLAEPFNTDVHKSSRSPGSASTEAKPMRQLTLQMCVSPHMKAGAASPSIAPAASAFPPCAEPFATTANAATIDVAPTLTKRRLNLSTPPKSAREVYATTAKPTVLTGVLARGFFNTDHFESGVSNTRISFTILGTDIGNGSKPSAAFVGCQSVHAAAAACAPAASDRIDCAGSRMEHSWRPPVLTPDWAWDSTVGPHGGGDDAPGKEQQGQTQSHSHQHGEGTGAMYQVSEHQEEVAMGVSLPEWSPRRPGYADLATAVLYRRAHRLGLVGGPAANDLPQCWGVGLLGDHVVMCNMVLNGALALIMKAAAQAVLEEDLKVDVVKVISGDGLSHRQKKELQRQMEERLRRAAAEQMAAERPREASGGCNGGSGPCAQRLSQDGSNLSITEILTHMPEFIPISEKLETVILGQGSAAHHPWEDVPAMNGQASLHLRPGCSLRAGEMIGVYSGEAWLHHDWQAKVMADPGKEWDEPDHHCPYGFSAARKHEFGRYAADMNLPEDLLNRVPTLNLPDDRVKLLLAKEPQNCGKVFLTAARLGCPLASGNDPIRNMRAMCEDELDNRDGGPNSELVATVVLGFLPVLILVSKTDLQGPQHITYSYGIAYWGLHEEEQAVCRDVEAARELARLECSKADHHRRRRVELKAKLQEQHREIRAQHREIRKLRKAIKAMCQKQRTASQHPAPTPLLEPLQLHDQQQQQLEREHVDQLSVPSSPKVDRAPLQPLHRQMTQRGAGSAGPLNATAAASCVDSRGIAAAAPVAERAKAAPQSPNDKCDGYGSCGESTQAKSLASPLGKRSRLDGAVATVPDPLTTRQRSPAMELASPQPTCTEVAWAQEPLGALQQPSSTRCPLTPPISTDECLAVALTGDLPLVVASTMTATSTPTRQQAATIRTCYDSRRHSRLHLNRRSNGEAVLEVVLGKQGDVDGSPTARIGLMQDQVPAHVRPQPTDTGPSAPADSRRAPVEIDGARADAVGAGVGTSAVGAGASSDMPAQAATDVFTVAASYPLPVSPVVFPQQREDEDHLPAVATDNRRVWSTGPRWRVARKCTDRDPPASVIVVDLVSDSD